MQIMGKNSSGQLELTTKNRWIEKDCIFVIKIEVKKV